MSPLSWARHCGECDAQRWYLDREGPSTCDAAWQALSDAMTDREHRELADSQYAALRAAHAEGWSHAAKALKGKAA